MRSLVMSPWANCSELLTVYKSIYNEIDLNYETLLFAKNKLTIWLTRIENNNQINVHLIATKTIISALIEDNNRDKYGDESAIYSLYALSVIRFCNAITQYSNESNMKSVKGLAHKYSCPQWIIDCRHSLCHSSPNQPSIEQLRSAATIGLNWLKQFFWQRIIANNNDKNCFELINRFINGNDMKIRKKAKKEIIFSIRYFRNELISAFIQHLVNYNNYNNNSNSNSNNNSNNENKIDYESLKLPKLHLRKFRPFFTIINNYNSISILLFLLTDNFNSENRSVSHLSLSWFSSIIKAIKSDNKISKFHRCFALVNYNSVMHKIEWIRLLYRLAKYPNRHTSTLITLIAPIVSDFISKDKIQIMINLSDIYCNNEIESNDKKDEDIDKVDSIKSVKDLITVVNEDNVDLNYISDPTDWSHIHFGVSYSCPSAQNSQQISDN